MRAQQNRTADGGDNRPPVLRIRPGTCGGVGGEGQIRSERWRERVEGCAYSVRFGAETARFDSCAFHRTSGLVFTSDVLEKDTGHGNHGREQDGPQVCVVDVSAVYGFSGSSGGCAHRSDAIGSEEMERSARTFCVSPLENEKWVSHVGIGGNRRSLDRRLPSPFA